MEFHPDSNDVEWQHGFLMVNPSDAFKEMLDDIKDDPDFSPTYKLYARIVKKWNFYAGALALAYTRVKELDRRMNKAGKKIDKIIEHNANCGPADRRNSDHWDYIFNHAHGDKTDTLIRIKQYEKILFPKSQLKIKNPKERNPRLPIPFARKPDEFGVFILPGGYKLSYTQLDDLTLNLV